ncbi:branched-chain amino acid ABC transporter permease [Desulfovibrio sp. OttesenSCG-928-A18]|nr:branched-chain amino acid ABC transporter permease [Desulfovibrio sp. OttesenSCG-928-A18]
MKSHPLRDPVCNLASIILLFVLLYIAEEYLDLYNKRILNLVAINTILALSLNLIYGFTGMFSLGHAGFMAVGAYVCTLLILTPGQKKSMWMLEPIQPWLEQLSFPLQLSNLFGGANNPALHEFAVQLGFFGAVLLGGLAAAIFGLFIALPVLRLGGDYLGIATLGFAEIIRVLITNLTPITNGALGIKGIPNHATLWWNFGWLVFTLYFIIALMRSNVGNVFKAVRDDEIAAKTMGVNSFFYRVLAFTIGAFFAGVGGALMAALLSTIDPKMYVMMLTFNVLMMVVAGGLGSITGSIIGSIVITVMLEWLRIVESPLNIFGFTLNGIPGMRMVIFSVLLLLIILFRREGLMGTREFSWDFVFRTGRKP